MHRLQQRASNLFNQHCSGTECPTSLSIIDNLDPDLDELAIFGGQTRSLVGKQRSPNTTVQSSSHANPSAASLAFFNKSPGRASDGDPATQTILQPDVHSSLTEHMPSLSPGINASFSTAKRDCGAIHELPGLFVERNDIRNSPFNSDMIAPSSSFSLENLTSWSVDRDTSLGLSRDFISTSPSVDPLQKLYAETLEVNMWGLGVVDEDGSAMKNTSDVDEDWAKFMKDSGLV